MLPLKENVLLFSPSKGRPAPCKAVLVQCRIVYKSLWTIHRRGEKKRERHTRTHRQRQCVCMSVCSQLSRRGTYRQRQCVCIHVCVFSTVKKSRWLPKIQYQIQWFCQVQFLAIVYGPGCHLPTCQFSNSATTGMGENSPATYNLQGS